MQFYNTIDEVQAAYLAKAKASESPVQAVKIGNEIRASSTDDRPFFHAMPCPVEVKAKVLKKYIKTIGDKQYVLGDSPIRIVSETPSDYFDGAKDVYAFQTGDLGEQNDLLIPKAIEPAEGVLPKTWVYVTFPAKHNFAVLSKKVTVTMYRSAVDGGLYEEAQLPEQDQSKCLVKYTAEVKAERNARISDTDSYIQVSDMTVMSKAKAKRSQLTDEGKEEIKTYRQELRDLPEKTGFPFVDFPEIPSCIAYECRQKIDSRNKQMNQGGF